MSKIIITLFIIFSYNLFSKSYEGNFKLKLTFYTLAQGSEKIEILRNKTLITYNSMKMPSERVLIGRGILGYLLFTPLSEGKDKCTKKYRFKRIKNKQTEEESGCIRSERFTRLLWAFETI